MKKKSGRFSALLGITIVAALMGSCSSGENADANPYEAEFSSARELATSDFETKVLADDKISLAEMKEAFDRYGKCLKDRYDIDLEVSFDSHGNIAEHTEDTPAKDFKTTRENSQECRIGTIAVLEPLYTQVTDNPSHRDRSEVVFECLEKENILPEGFTLEDYKEIVNKRIEILKENSSASPDTYPQDQVSAVTTLSNGIDLDLDEKAVNCSQFPNRG